MRAYLSRFWLYRWVAYCLAYLAVYCFFLVDCFRFAFHGARHGVLDAVDELRSQVRTVTWVSGEIESAYRRDNGDGNERKKAT